MIAAISARKSTAPVIVAVLLLAGCTLKTQALQGQSARQAEQDRVDCESEARGVPYATHGGSALISPTLRELSYIVCMIQRGYEAEVPVTVEKIGLGYGVPTLSMKVRANGPKTELETGRAISACAGLTRARHMATSEDLGSQAVSTFGLGLVNPHRSEDERAFVGCMAERGFSAK